MSNPIDRYSESTYSESRDRRRAEHGRQDMADARDYVARRALHAEPDYFGREG